MVRTNGHGPGSGERLRVLLAIYEFPMLSLGLRGIVEAEPDMELVGELRDRDALADDVARTAADVVVTECLPFDGAGCTPFAAIETIRAAKSTARIVALECRCRSEQFALAIKAGADGYLTREARPADVVTALRSVARGQAYVSPAIVTRMVNTYVLRAPQGGLDDPYETLSEREREVLLLAAVGNTNREIGRTLHLAEQTIHNYRASAMEKLDLHDRVDLLKYAIRRGLVDVADL